MKRRYIGAIATVALALTAYPFLKQLAIAERGYNAIGGEECVLVFAGLVALLLILDGRQRYRKPERGEDGGQNK